MSNEGGVGEIVVTERIPEGATGESRNSNPFVTIILVEP